MLVDAELVREAQSQIRWFGHAVETMPSASAVLKAAVPMTDEERASALRFYEGVQWPEDIKAKRMAQHRPILVVNRLPELVAAALAKEYGAFAPGEALPLSVQRDIAQVKAVIAHENRDAQMVYNYLVSALVEQAMWQPGEIRKAGA